MLSLMIIWVPSYIIISVLLWFLIGKNCFNNFEEIIEKYVIYFWDKVFNEKLSIDYNA